MIENVPDKKILGVCSWLSQTLKTDVKILRVLFVIVTVISIGTAAIIYFGIWVARELKLF